MKEHWTKTKAVALKTVDEVGNEVLYDGLDKDELVPFGMWEGRDEVVAKDIEVVAEVTPKVIIVK